MMGLFTSGWTTSIRRIPLSVASRLLPLRTMYSRLSSTSMMDGARGRRAEAGLLHGVGEFLFVERLARGLHGGEQRRVGETLGRPRLLFEDFDVEHVLRLAFGEAGRQCLSSGGIGRRPDAAFFALARRQVQHLPADLLHGAARGVIAVDDGGVANRGDHRGDAPDVVVVPGAEQAAADEVVDLALVGRERGLAGRGGGGNDGVVIGDLGVVDEAAAEGTLAGAGREVLAIGRGDGVRPPRGRVCGHILREVAAIGARIADQLVAFVEGLRECRASSAR